MVKLSNPNCSMEKGMMFLDDTKITGQLVDSVQ